MARLIEVLEGINQDAGYHTDAGLYVYRRPHDVPGPDGLTAPAMVVSLESLSLGETSDSTKAFVSMSVIVSGVVSADPATPTDAALMEILFDIRAAVLAPDVFPDLFDPSAVQMDTATFPPHDPGHAFREVRQPVTINFPEIYEVSS